MLFSRFSWKSLILAHVNVLWGGGACVLITQPQAIPQARGVCGGGGEGEGEVVEQQTGALGNPRSSFSSSSSLLCIRRGFDKNFTLGSAVQSPRIDSKEPIPPGCVARARICNRLWSPGIDFEKSIRQTMWLGGPVRKIGLSYWPARLGIDSWAPQTVYKYGLWRAGSTTLFLLGFLSPKIV